ncbi:DUF7133 domain-containing protein [Bremerella cremea]|uniref:DUF7133 domain-containing protein n=1 Tax=Bremerella cremea TaxID=1031537 RepID=UPI0031E6E1E0
MNHKTWNSSKALICAWVVIGLQSIALAAAPPKSPAEQQKLFHLPPGFEIQLVASEPEIGQPMNLNFDAQGRLWITSSIEYPYPADSPGVQPRPDRFTAGADEKHAPRDWVAVVEGFDANGRATKVTRFASGLNIPIGQIPIGDGNEAIVYSIPNLDKWTDADGDGIADQRTKLYGSIGNVDTHGMSNGYTPWIDGWIYGCHGFTNTSEITDAQGNVTRMQSGNTYRFKADGSQFEQFTFGQVNPFGMTFDPLGNLYDADCHTMPVYQLIRGALYPHFGAKPDALGFGPTMINHNHGSTGICGPAYYADDHFPADFRDNIFICNPVSQVIHRDKLKQFGSTYLIDTQPDLITCDDSWFRPVDVMMGPDGALYIADFYNPIIGHYEAPLDHPDRDRTHGRVWRVIYTGNEGASYETPSDLTKMNIEQLWELLSDPNLFVRTQATNRLVEKYGEEAAVFARKNLPASSAVEKAHGLWIMERAKGLTDFEARSFSNIDDRLVRVHLIKALAERPQWTDFEFEVTRRALNDPDAFVVRAAVDGLGRHPNVQNWRPLLETWSKAMPQDTHLIHAIRLALREHFRTPDAVKGLDSVAWNKEEMQQLIAIAKVSETANASRWLFQNSKGEAIDWDVMQQVARQAAQLNDQSMLASIIELTADSPAAGQLGVLQAWCSGERERGRRPIDNEVALAWTKRVTAPLLVRAVEARGWTALDLSGKTRLERNPFAPRSRETEDRGVIEFLDSIVHGEKQTGILRSRVLELPGEVRFSMCGQDGLPGQPSTETNLVRVCLEDGQVIAQQLAPRSDRAPRYVLDTSNYQGRLGYVEVVDGNANDLYAWIAVADFAAPLPPLPMPGQSETKDQLLNVLVEFRLDESTKSLLAGLQKEDVVFEDRLDLANTLIALGEAGNVEAALTQWVHDPALTTEQYSKAIRTLGSMNSESSRATLVGLLPTVAAAQQLEIGLALSRNETGIRSLVETVAAGKASPYLLQDPKWKQQADAVLKSDDLRQQIAKLTSNLPPREAQEQQRFAKFLAGYPSSNGDLAAGRATFEKRCATCHQLGGKGALIGPQLDGVGNRPVERIVEDVLIPNRNVDAAFRTVLIQTVDGQVISGLPRREEGEILVLANAEGIEVRIAKEEIDLRKDSPLSLMPGNFAEQMSPDELNGLIRFLEQQKKQ